VFRRSTLDARRFSLHVIFILGGAQSLMMTALKIDDLMRVA